MPPLMTALARPIPQPDAPPRMSEEAFVAWCDDDTHAEWVDGEVQLMSPVNLDHAEIVTFVTTLLNLFVTDRGLGTVLNEPFQIRFAALRRRRSPDVIFVRKERRPLFAKAYLEGAPDLVVEVISPDSQTRDRREKFGEYQAAGVREFWLVDPLTRELELHVLDDGGQYSPITEVNGRFRSQVLPGFYLCPAWLWQIPLPKPSVVIREIDNAD